MKLYCRSYSSGDLKELHQSPIIFLHGMAFNGNTFKKVAPIISKKTKRKVYVPDIRNHGKSPWTEEMNYDVLTNDLLELMQEYGIIKTILIGSSMGGRIAMNFALKHPDMVQALVIEDMTPRNIVSSGTNLVQVIYKQVKSFFDSFSPDIDLDEAKMNLVEIIINAFPFLGEKEKVPEVFDSDFVPIVKEGDRIRLECNEVVVVGMLENDALVQNLPDLNVTFDGNALFIYGSKGFFNLAKDPTVRKLFPKAVIRKVEGASHLLHLDSPEEYTSIVTDFIIQKYLPQSKY